MLHWLFLDAGVRRLQQNGFWPKWVTLTRD
jgi:hypothetical protein